MQAAVDAQYSPSQAAAADYSATQAAVDAQYSPSQVNHMFPQEAFQTLPGPCCPRNPDLNPILDTQTLM